MSEGKKQGDVVAFMREEILAGNMKSHVVGHDHRWRECKKNQQGLGTEQRRTLIVTKMLKKK